MNFMYIYRYIYIYVMMDLNFKSLKLRSIRYPLRQMTKYSLLIKNVSAVAMMNDDINSKMLIDY